MVTTGYRVIVAVVVLLLLVLAFMIWTRHMVLSQHWNPLVARIGQVCSLSIGATCLIFIFAANRAVAKQDSGRDRPQDE